MNNLQNIKNVYFLGIGGIGMSALARYFKFTGRDVAGYDRTVTPLTQTLEKEGIRIHYEDDIRNIPSNWNPVETLAVFTPALPDDHNELSWFRQKPIGLLKRAKVLGLICNEQQGIAVAGTHGKTTVSTMAANILFKTEAGCGAFLGGISKNFGSNLVLPRQEPSWIVAEADEFDRSFLHLQPEIALVTSLDPDHLDIYGNKAKMVESFEKFISLIRNGGTLVLKKGVEIDTGKTAARVMHYALHDQADFYTQNLHIDPEGGGTRFDLHTPEGIMADCRMNYPGLINVENAVGASALALLAGAGEKEIREGLEDYQGVVRRFDVRFKSESQVYIDDYAHHPEELKAVISSVKAIYPGRKLTGIFQPHLYSRTRDFADGFAGSLDMLDKAVLVPLYPAREDPIPGIDSGIIFEKMQNPRKWLLPMEEVSRWLREESTEIILTMGAGNIDTLADEIIEVLQNKTHVA